MHGVSNERIIFRYLLGTAIEKIITTAAVIAAVHFTIWGLCALAEYIGSMMGFVGILLGFLAIIVFSAWWIWYDHTNSIELNGGDDE